MEEGANYWSILRRHVLCPDHGMDITADSLTDHCRRLHGTKPAINWDSLLVRYHKHLPQVYGIIPPWDIIKCQCPLPGCPRPPQSIIGIRNYFNRMHWNNSILIIEEHFAPYQHCVVSEKLPLQKRIGATLAGTADAKRIPYNYVFKLTK